MNPDPATRSCSQGSPFHTRGDFLYQSFSRRLFAGAAATAVVIAVMRVTSVPVPSSEPTPPSLGAALNDMGDELRGTVVGVRSEIDWWRAAYARMSADVRRLDDTLTVENITSSTR
jgi:hypothetical protein